MKKITVCQTGFISSMRKKHFNKYLRNSLALKKLKKQEKRTITSDAENVCILGFTPPKISLLRLNKIKVNQQESKPKKEVQYLVNKCIQFSRVLRYSPQALGKRNPNSNHFHPFGFKNIIRSLPSFNHRSLKRLEMGIFENGKVWVVWAEGVREGSRELQST